MGYNSAEKIPARGDLSVIGSGRYLEARNLARLLAAQIQRTADQRGERRASTGCVPADVLCLVVSEWTKEMIHKQQSRPNGDCSRGLRRGCRTLLLKNTDSK